MKKIIVLTVSHKNCKHINVLDFTIKRIIKKILTKNLVITFYMLNFAFRQ